ncbi:unnamed protein product [Paramecium primaurelia]|uniref:NACHT domain-containing protein n=1 Tax=Paramecium primaurelia TaxID=5886 RepID=A0A8S1KGC3_PARPR|nr:unnamed protein product [Paramecium primaurelia]
MVLDIPIQSCCSSLKSVQNLTKRIGQEKLRGGGSSICSTQQSRPNKPNKPEEEKKKLKLPSNFAEQLRKHSNMIYEKSNYTLEKNSKKELNASIQWFIFNKYYINSLVYDEDFAQKYSEKILDAVALIIQAIPNFITMSCFLLHDLLQILNELLRFLVSQKFKSLIEISEQKKVKKILIEPQLQKTFLDYISKAKQEIKALNKQIWETGISFELRMAKAAILNFETNEGETIFKQLVQHTVLSFINMQPSIEFVTATFDAGKYLFQLAQSKWRNKQYQFYFFFEELKWYIIKRLHENCTLDSVQNQLSKSYQNNIKESDNWLVHFCWVRTLSDLIFYRPLVEKENLFQNMQNKYEQNNLWDNEINTGYLLRSQFDENIAQVVFSDKYENKGIYEKKGIYQLFRNLESFQLWLMQQYNPNAEAETFKSLLDYVRITSFSDQSKNDARMNNRILFGNPNINNLKNNINKLNQLFDKNKKIIEGNNIDNQQLVNNNIIQSAILCQEIYNQFQLLQEQTEYVSLLIDDKNEKNKKNGKNETIDKNGKNETIKKNETIEKNETIIKNEKNQKNEDKITLEEYNFNQFSKYLVDKQEVKENLKNLNKIIEDFLSNQNKEKELLDFQILNNKKESKIEPLKFEEILKEIFSFTISKQFIQGINEQYKIIIAQNQRDIDKLINLLLGLQKVVQHLLLKYQSLKQQVQILLDNEDTQKRQLDQDHLKKIEYNKYIRGFFREELEMLSQLTSSPSKSFDSDKINDIMNTISQNIKQANTVYKEAFLANQYIQYAAKIRLLLSQLKYIENVDNQLANLTTILGMYKNKKEEFIPSTDNQQSQKIPYERTLSNVGQHTNSHHKILNKIFKKENEINKFYEIISRKVEEFQNYQEYIQCIDDHGDQDYQQIVTFENDTIDKFQKETLEHIIKDEFYNLIITREEIYSNKFIINFFECMANILNQNNPNDFNELSTTYVKDSKFLKQDSSDDYKVRECLFFNIMKGQIIIKEQHVVKFCQLIIQQLWMEEKNENVRNIFKDKEMIDQQKSLYSQGLNSLSKQLQQEFREKLKALQKLEAEIQHEGVESEKSILKKQLEQKSKDFHDYLNNIEEMSSQINLSFLFLQEIHKDFQILQQKIDKIQLSVDEILIDLRVLRGKKYIELLKTRKKKVQNDQQITEMNSIYIELMTNRSIYEPISNQENSKYRLKGEIKNSYLLIESQDESNQMNLSGDVNDFLYGKYNKQDQNFDVMLIRGQAGSGKSRAAKKIEEYIWKQYNSEQSNWIPIFVSLPSLKDPKTNLFNEALESDYYHFDKIQIKEFKDAICNERANVVFILDSYDELKDDVKKQNLYATNEFTQQFNIELHRKNLKLIITTRSEILQEKYFLRWFTDIELKQFTDQQRANYLQQYSILNIKKKIFGLYEYVQQIEGKKVDPEDVKYILNQFEQLLNSFQYDQTQEQNQKQQFLTQHKAQLILDKISSIPNFKYVKDEQKIILQKELIGLWSKQKYQDSINNLQMGKILQTPYMMEIVVQVLPNFAKIYSEATQIKEMFKQNYMIIKRREQSSQNKILKDNKEKKDEQQLKQLDLFVKRLDEIQFFQNFSILDNLSQISSYKLTDEEKKVVISAFKLKKFTIYEFYENFIQYYHSQQIQKQYRLGNVHNFESLAIDLWDFSESLALEMTVHDQTYFSHKVQGVLKLKKAQECIGPEQNWSDQYFNGELEEQQYKKIIRSCILLSCKGNVYSFTHKSIQEFFVSKYIINLFDNHFEKKKLQLKDLELSLYNKDIFNTSKIHFQKVCEFITNFFQTNEDKIVNHLKSILNLSKNNENYKRAASNSVFLLSQFKTYMGEQDFRKIYIADTKINGLSFFASDLSSSRFSGVEVDGCNFNLSKIENSTWAIICNEQRTLSGHENKKITSLLMSPEGKTLYSSSEDQTIVVWDYTKRKQINKLQGHQGIINCLSISQNGFYLASGGTDNTIYIWDCTNQNKTQIKTIQTIKDHQGSVNSLYFSLDQTILASASSDKSVLLISDYQKQEQTKKRFIKHKEKVMQVVVFPDSIMLATRCSDCTVTIWNIGENVPNIIRVFLKLPEPITCIALSHDGTYLMTGCKNVENQGFIKAWEITQENQRMESENLQFPIFCLSICPNSNLIAAGSKDQIIIWEKFQFIDHKSTNPKIIQCKGEIISLVFSMDVYYLLSLNSKQRMELWQLKNYIVKHSFQLISAFLIGFIGKEHFVAVQTSKKITVEKDLDMIQICEIQSGRSKCFQLQDIITAGQIFKTKLQIALGFQNGIIGIWEWTSESYFDKFDQEHDRKIINISISSDDKTLISIDKYQTIKIWIAESKQCKNTINDIQNPINKIQIYAQMMIYVYQQEKDDIIRFHDTDKNEIIKEFSGYSGRISQLVFSQNNQKLLFIITNQEGESKIGLINFLQESKIYKGDGCEFSQIVISQYDEKFAGIGENRSLNIWDFQDQKLQESSISQKVGITSMTFTRQSNLISGQEDGSIILWQKKGEETIKMFEGHSDFVQDICFSPDGLTLLSCSQKDNVIIWDMEKYKKRTTIDKQANQVMFFPTYPSEQLLLLKNKQTIAIWDIIEEQAKNLPSLFDFKSQNEINYYQEQIYITGVTISKSGLQIVCGLSNGDIKLFKQDQQQWIELEKTHNSKINKIQFQPCVSSQEDENFIASGSDDQTIQIWKNNGNQYNPFKKLDNHMSEVKALTFTSNGKQLASGDSNGSVIIWETEQYQNYNTIEGGAEIIAMAYSPDNSILAFGMIDKIIKLWDIKNEKAIQQIQSINEQIGSIVFSIDSIMAYSFGQEINLCKSQYEQDIGNNENEKQYFPFFKFAKEPILQAEQCFIQNSTIDDDTIEGQENKSMIWLFQQKKAQVKEVNDDNIKK